MLQRDSLRGLILDYCNDQDNRTFTLQDFIAKYGDFSHIGIGGNTPHATVRRLLQELRNENFISFLDQSGCYTLRGVEFLASEKAALKSIDITHESPEKKEYLMEVYVRKSRWVMQAKEKLGLYCLAKDCHNSFIKEDGSPYIEVHHIIPLSCGGEDGLWNLTVLCAHHHRMAHFANTHDKIMLTDYLRRETKHRIGY